MRKETVPPSERTAPNSDDGSSKQRANEAGSVDGQKKKEETRRLRRQRRLRQLEHRAQCNERKKRLHTIPGERVYPIPHQLKPISLFIRMGSLASEHENVPLEYYGASDEDSSIDVGTTQPHPAAVQTIRMFHLQESYPFSPTNFALGDTGAEVTQESLEEFNRIAQTRRRPHSISMPLAGSAMKKDLDKGDSKRPRSLRFLDPKDQKLYLAVSHRKFLSDLHMEITNDQMSTSLDKMHLDPQPDNRDFATPLAKKVTDPGILADCERSGNEWSKDDSDYDATLRVPRNLEQRNRDQPIAIKGDSQTSTESSDVSGCEADNEGRQGRTTVHRQ